MGIPQGGGRARARRSGSAAAREFHEETALTDWSFLDGFERDLSYTYIRRGRKIVKTVTYYLAEVRDATPLACSPEHMEDPSGHWYQWGTFEQITALLYHSKIRQVLADADEWLKA